MVNTRLGEDTIRPVGNTVTYSGYGDLFVCSLTDNRIYKSIDNGDTWDSGTLITSSGVFDICFLSNGWLLSAGYTSGKVYKSTDAGVTWDSGVSVAANNSLTGITQLANGNVVAVERATDKFFTSTDNGATWDAGVSVGGVVLQDVIQLTDGSVIVTAYTSGKVYKSLDNGATWDAGVTVGTQIRGICQVANGDLLCAGSAKVYKSTDNGATWDAGTTVAGVDSRLLYHEGFVYASSLALGMYRSADDGGTWSSIGNSGSGATQGLTSNSIHTISVPSGASGLMLQCSCATPAYWRTDRNGLGGFRLTSSSTNPVTLWFDPVQTPKIFLDYHFGTSVKYQFVTP